MLHKIFSSRGSVRDPKVATENAENRVHLCDVSGVKRDTGYMIRDTGYGIRDFLPLYHFGVGYRVGERKTTLPSVCFTVLIFDSGKHFLQKWQLLARHTDVVPHGLLHDVIFVK